MTAETKRRSLEYALLTLLIFVSGNPIVSRRYVYPMLGLAGAVYLWTQRGRRSVHCLAAYTIAFVLLFAGQYLCLGQISLPASANHLCKLFFGAAVFLYLGAHFRERFLDIMAVLSGISLIFYIFQCQGWLVPALFPGTSEHLHSILIHQVCTLRQEYLRNCGIFWEPGAYAGYLFLSLALYVDDGKKLLREHPWKTLLIILALISTLSTGAYLFLALLLLYFVLVECRQAKWWYYLSLAATLLLLFAAFHYLPFLQAKISHQLDITREQLQYEDKPLYYESRTGAFVVDAYYVRKHPWVGNGFPEVTRFADHPQDWDRIRKGHSNGFSNLFACFGIPMALLHFLLLYLRIPFRESRKWIFLFFYLMLLQEEQFLNFPFFIALPFVILPGLCSQRY